MVDELASRTFSAIVPVGNVELNFEMAKLTHEKRIEHWAMSVGDMYDSVK